MKNYEEMARDVFQRINEYETERKAKRAKITKVAASVTPVCAAAVVGVGLWKGGVLTTDHNQLISSTVDSTVSDSDIFPSTNNDTSESNGKTNNNGADANSNLSTSDTMDSTHMEDSKVDSTPIEDDSPTIENNNAVVVDTSQITDYEPLTITEEPSVKTEVPVQHTNPVTQTEPVEQTVTPSEGSNHGNSWCILSSKLELNDTTYYDNDMADISAYNRDRYIGKVSDFNGEYSDDFNYRISPDDSVYTVKETDTILLVVKADINSPYGAVIVMSSPDWSLDKYELERLDPGYIDPNALADESAVVFNGFCQ